MTATETKNTDLQNVNDQCRSCGKLAQLRVCEDCGLAGYVIDCGHYAQPRPLAASERDGETTCASCEDDRSTARRELETCGWYASFDNDDRDGKDQDRLLAVTVQISQRDYDDMKAHFAKDKLGRPMVTVHGVVQWNEFADRGEYPGSFIGVSPAKRKG